MKARIVLAGLLVGLIMVEASAQRAEYDDMYFRGKDRERNKALEAEKAYASAKTSKAPEHKQDEVIPQEDDTANPTDSYSARSVNPEYVSRANSENASEDENNYYLEGYTPVSSNNNFNNSYYNNAATASNSYYGNSRYNDPFFNRGYGCNYCSPQMSWMITSSPYYPYGFYDSWMNPYYSGYGSGWSMSFMYGNYWSPYGSYGYGYPYYGGYSYPGYYTGGKAYYESPNTVNYGKRPSRHSAVVQPTERSVTRTRNTTADNVANVNINNGTRQRQTQDEYYVRPSRRSSTTTSNNPVQWSNSNSGNSDNNLPAQQHSSPSRSRDSYTPSSYTPSYSPSSTPSPSRGGSGNSGSGGGGSSPRPRGRD